MRCVLNSGGMDSYLTWWLMSPQDAVDNVFVDIGHAYKDKELAALNRLRLLNPAFTYTVATGPLTGALLETPSGIIPNRNAELILAASSAGYSEIAMGVLHGEINSDKSPEFMAAMQTVLDITWRAQYWNATARVHRVWSPIRGFTKSALVAAYLALGGNPDTLLATVSCYSDKEGHCGRCASCLKRWIALTNNGVEQVWRKHPANWAEASTVQRKAKDGTYDKVRADEVLQAFTIHEGTK